MISHNNLRHSSVLITDSEENVDRFRCILAGIENNFFTVQQNNFAARILPMVQTGEFDISLINWEIIKSDGSETLKKLEDCGKLSSVILLIGESEEKANREMLAETPVSFIITENFTTERLAELIDVNFPAPENSGQAPVIEEGYTDLIEHLPVMSYAIEAKPPFSPIFVSPAFAAFGYPLEDWCNSADMWIKVLHPEDRDRVLRETEQAMAEGRNTNYNYRLLTHDGSIRWIHDQGGLAKDENDEVIFWQAAMVDVTELKAAERLLLRNEERFQQMFERNGAIKLFIEADSARIVKANPAACKFYGYTLKELKSKTLFDLNAAASDANAAEITVFGMKDQYEYRHLLASGEIRDVEVHTSLMNDEGQEQFYLIIYDITERKAAEAALCASKDRFRELFENASDLVYMQDLEGNFTAINRSVERVLGISREESRGLNVKKIVVPENLDLAREQIAGIINGGSGAAYELDCFARDGRRVSLEINSRLVFKNGKPVAIQCIARDITGRKLGEKELRESEERFRDLFENANDLIYTHDLEGNFTSFNRAAETITGFSRNEAINMNIAQIVAPEHVELARQMIGRKMGGESPTSYELDVITKDGARVTLELSIRLIYRNKQPVGLQGIGRDTTERKQAEAQLQQTALYDPLTKLPNRVHFMKHLGLAVERTEKESRYRYAVLYLDLDRFKLINDSLGHAVGDKLLIEIAEQLKYCVRPSDIIARLGGDEFTILLAIRREKDAVRVAERIQRHLSVPFKVDNYEVFTSASVGIIVSGGLHRTPEEVLRDADSAMYRAKETGRARYEIFDHDMHARNMTLLQLENDLRRAVERNEFEVFYQPIVSLETGQIREFEALIRWNRPEHGLVMPDDFISVAEETGLIIPIGEWIIRESCRQAMEWQAQSNPDERLTVSVNLSARQLMHPLLVPQVRRILRETGLAPELLRLEVTESMVMEHGDAAAAVVNSLQEIGIKLSTDDFGTGYSSLSYLHRFPFDRLKIDRSFVMKMDADLKTEAIVRTILLLGQNLEIEVTAEGIENDHQLWQLRSLGCKLGQGYFFARPVNAESATRLLIDGLQMDFGLMENPFAFSDTNSDPFVQIG